LSGTISSISLSSSHCTISTFVSFNSRLESNKEEEDAPCRRGSAFEVEGLGFGEWGLWLKVWGLRVRVWNVGLVVWGSGCGVPSAAFFRI